MSKRYGFTKHFKSDYAKLEREGKIVSDGINVKVISNHGPLSRLAMFK